MPPGHQKEGRHDRPRQRNRSLRGRLSGYKAALELFAELLSTGTIWHLRYSIRRTGDVLIAAGYLTPDGKITEKGQKLILAEEQAGAAHDANPRIDGASDDPIPGPFAVPNM